MSFRTWLVLFALVASTPAWAQFKCVAPDGKITYSEQPCARGAKPGAVGRATTPSAGGAAVAYVPPAQVTMNYYDVQGGDFNSLLGSLNARGTFHGKADWKLSYKYQSSQGAGGCAVSSLNTELELAMLLPRWTPPAGASGDLVGRWERYLSALRLHEEGHLDHGRGAEKAFQAVAATMTASDCGALDRAVRERFSQLLSDYQGRDRDYDRRTEHGKSQGAWFR